MSNTVKENYPDWSQAKKDEFTAVLGDVFGWKNMDGKIATARAKQLQAIADILDFDGFSGDAESVRETATRYELHRSNIDADYALLFATQEAINEQTKECPACGGKGTYYGQHGNIACNRCKGRGRIQK